MPRSFSCWNDKRRPGAKLFNDFSGIGAGAPGAGSSSLDPAASNPDEGGWSWSRSEQGLITEGLDVDELVASLTDDREVMEQFGVAQPPLSPPAAPSAPLGSPPALMPPLVADGITAWQPNGGGAPPAAGAIVAMDTSMDVEAAVAEGAPEGAEQPLVAATLIVAPEADPSGSGGAAGADGEAMAADPPQPSFEWTACNCPIRTDPSGAPLAAPVSASGAAGYGITVALQTPLLYWNERARWMWHKKWCLPRIAVVVSEPLGAGGSLGGPPLVAMVSCGTLRAGHEELHDQGLAGECTQRLNRTSGAQLEASFSSLLLQHTSFNCGNRPFHLFVTIAAHGPQGLQPLTCVSSPPIHVDARKRTKGERPEARAGDVRLIQRQRNSNQSGGGASKSSASAAAAPSAAAAAAAAAGGVSASVGLDSRTVELLEATGCVVLLVGLDWTVEAAITAEPFGYSRQQLVGGSLLRLMHPEEHLALVQTTQALVAAAAGAESPRSSLRATHRVLLHENGAARAAVADSTISIIRGTPARLLVSSRYAVPVETNGGPVFRVYPARQASVYSSV